MTHSELPCQPPVIIAPKSDFRRVPKLIELGLQSRLIWNQQVPCKLDFQCSRLGLRGFSLSQAQEQIYNYWAQYVNPLRTSISAGQHFSLSGEAEIVDSKARSFVYHTNSYCLKFFNPLVSLSLDSSYVPP